VAQLEQLDGFVEDKRRTAAFYQQAFGRVDGVRPFVEAPWARSTYWMASVLLDEGRCRDVRALIRTNAAGIQARPLWRPLHLQPAFHRAQRGLSRWPSGCTRGPVAALLGRHHAGGAAGRRGRGRAAAAVSRAVLLRDRLRRYYTATIATSWASRTGRCWWSSGGGGAPERPRRSAVAAPAIWPRPAARFECRCGTGGFNSSRRRWGFARSA
jgi:hypothetical protein